MRVETIGEADARFVVHHGDNMAILPTMADCSVDAIVTDPPAGIAFMGKAWDSDKGGRDAWIAWLSDVMGQCLRVLKPGGHALVWAIPRTSHWTGMAIENAGFEVRDRIAHVFGSGFPKNLDVSKAIDKARDDSADGLAVGAWLKEQREARGLKQKEVAALWPSVTGGLTGCVANWETLGKVPKWDQWLQLKAFIGFGDEMDAEVWRLNGRKGTPGEAWQTADVLGVKEGAMSGWRAEASTGLSANFVDREVKAANSDAARQWQGWGTALKPAIEDWWLARKPLVGSVAANVMAHGTGALNIDKCRIDGEAWKAHRATGLGSVKFFSEGDAPVIDKEPHALGRWPANLIHSGEPEVLAAFPQTGPSIVSMRGAGLTGVVFSKGNPAFDTMRGHSDTGSAARFFMQCPPDEATSLYYTPKASRSDRDKGNTHSTVKPIALMRYLCRLITPPDGVVLDVFCGSGSTGQAAMFEGFRFIGIEQDAGHVDLARHRVGLAARNGWQPGLELESAA